MHRRRHMRISGLFGSESTGLQPVEGSGEGEKRRCSGLERTRPQSLRAVIRVDRSGEVKSKGVRRCGQMAVDDKENKVSGNWLLVSENR